MPSPAFAMAVYQHGMAGRSFRGRRGAQGAVLGEAVVRWVVIPGIVASGFAMWFAAPLSGTPLISRAPLV